MISQLQTIKQRFGIIGISPKLDHALQKAIRVAPTDLTVLITGESGVGKEVFSKIIHQLSPRRHFPFLAINCGAIPPGTINSELFGHEKGAFTGATNERKGYFEVVNKGTIFLDEVSELPLDTQAYLLRVLETGEFIRVGSSTVRKTDVRVIAASNVDLLERVRQGKFREDLYYRLNIVPIYIPPLRERKEDIPILFRKFTRDCAEKYNAIPVKLTPEAEQMLINYYWPGNIRQLKNVAEQLCILSDNGIITPEQLRTVIPDIDRPLMPTPYQRSNGDKLEEREILYRLLFDMKKDIDALKHLIYRLIKENNLQLEQQHMPVLNAPSSEPPVIIEPQPSPSYSSEPSKPVVEVQPKTIEVQPAETTLNLYEMEKQLIQKALKKHHGKRRAAAKELGISERTLYRKIKQYQLE